MQEKVRGGEIKVDKVKGKENPADLMTKNLPACEMHAHMGRMGYEVSDSRSLYAPRLSKISQEYGDNWKIDEGGQVTRNHFQWRRELFTPTKVAGAPPTNELTALRVTRGVFADGKEFARKDDWTVRSTAHLMLKQPWTGTTTFFSK